MKFFGILACLLSLYFIGCSNVTAQSKKSTIMDASAEDTLGGSGTSSSDIRSMAERMAREIFGLKLAKGKIALSDFVNETRFAFNTNIIKDRLLTDLVEISANKDISFTLNASMANYLLDARITALSKGSQDGVSDYMLYSFKLVDKESNILWMKSYETKKQSTTGVMYR